MLKSKLIKLKKVIKLLFINFQPSIKNYIIVERDNDIKKLDAPKENTSGKYNNWDFFLKHIEREFNENPTSFLRSKYISQTIHPNEQKKINKLLYEMSNDTFAKKFILPFLNETAYGDPFISEEFRFASPMSIQHAYYIYLIYKHFSIFLPRSNIDNIVDFGGGYGNFCKIIHQLGYNKKYNIIDFDIMHKIQKKFISHNLPKKIYKDLDLNYLNSIDELNDLNNFKDSFFIASYSLSETSKEIRSKIEAHLYKFKYLFIIYQRYFNEIDNKEYFKNLENNLKKSGTACNIHLEKIKSYLLIYKKH